MADSFECSLVTPEEKVLEDTLVYASIPAWDGQVGIAPGRAALLVRLGIGTLRLDFAEGGTHYYLIEGGFAQMVGNVLTILSDGATPAENLIVGEADGAYEEALKKKAVGEQEVQERDAALQTAREKRRLSRLAEKRGV